MIAWIDKFLDIVMCVNVTYNVYMFWITQPMAYLNNVIYGHDKLHTFTYLFDICKYK